MQYYKSENEDSNRGDYGDWFFGVRCSVCVQYVRSFQSNLLHTFTLTNRDAGDSSFLWDVYTCIADITALRPRKQLCLRKLFRD
jgi:hypothetical protein